MLDKISLSNIGAALFGMSKKHCEQHAAILKTLEKSAIQQALNADLIAQNTKDLEDGREEFKEVNTAIEKINYNVAYLTGKADARRSTNDDKKGEHDESGRNHD